jgi:hypothetical protein
LKARLLKIFFLIAASCSTSQLWVVQTIEAGNPLFTSSKLRFLSPQAHPSLSFEMVQTGGEIEAFIHLTRFRFHSSDPIKILFTIHGEEVEDWVSPNEGRMRARIPPEMTAKLIQALQDGDEVSILIDGFEETLDPNQFSSSFAKFLGKGHFLQNFFKGPI